MKKRSISVLLTLTLLLVLCACSKDTGEGKNIVYPIDNDPVYLDPQIATDKGGLTIINNIFEGLVRFDENGNPTGGAASSWEVSDDKMQYTFHLRENASWLVTKTASRLYLNEGEESKSFTIPLTAKDFVFAFKRGADKATGSENADYLYSIKNAYEINKGRLSTDFLGVKAIDDSTLTISLEYPDNDFLKKLTTSVCMPCNEEFFLLTKGRYGLSNEYLIYNGAFYIASWQEKTSITVYANEEYKGNTAAKPSSVYFSMNNEYDTRAKKLMQDTYDASPLTYEQYLQVENEKGYTYIQKENTLWGLVFNCGDSVMKSYDARLAISYAFDMSLLQKTDDFSGKASGIIPGEMKINGKSYREKAGKLKKLSYNTDKAEKYWKKALEELNVNALSVTILSVPAHENEIRGVLQNLQKAFGISCDVRVKTMEESEITAAVANGNYQIAYIPIKAQTDFAADMLIYCAELANYNNSSFNRLSDEITSSNNSVEKLTECENHLIQNSVVLPAFFAKDYYALRKNVSGIYFSDCGQTATFISAIKFD